MFAAVPVSCKSRFAIRIVLVRLAPRLFAITARRAGAVLWLSPSVPAFALRTAHAIVASAKAIRARLLLANEFHFRRLGTIHRQNAPPLQRTRLVLPPRRPYRSAGLAPEIGRLCASGRKRPFLAHRLAFDAELTRQTRAELIFQDAGFYFLHLARLQVLQHERPEGNTNEPVHGQAKVLHDLADFAIFALADRKRDPDIAALLAFQRSFDRTVIHAVRPKPSR